MPSLSKLNGQPDTSDPVSAYFRERRMRLFCRLTRGLPKPVRILDVGGTQSFWDSNPAFETGAFQVTLLNLAKNSRPPTRENFASRVGDATDLSLISRSDFDFVHSNSVIEHLFTWEQQLKMAEQILALDLPFWIQTPNYWFPMEPHYRIPGLQLMPRGLRIRVLHLKRCGRRASAAEWNRSVELVDEVRLLRVREVRRLFPQAKVIRERFGPFTKSVIAHQGLGRSDRRSA